MIEAVIARSPETIEVKSQGGQYSQIFTHPEVF